MKFFEVFKGLQEVRNDLRGLKRSYGVGAMNTRGIYPTHPRRPYPSMARRMAGNLGFWDTPITGQIDGPTLTAAAAASYVPVGGLKTLQANFFDVPGKQLIVEAWGRISTVITTPGTIRYDVRFGGTVVFDSLAVLGDTVIAHTTVGWYLKIAMTARSPVPGPSATLHGQGIWVCEAVLGTPGAAPSKCAAITILPWNSAPAVGTAFNSQVSQQVDGFFTQTVATGSLTCHQYALYSPN